MSVLFTTNKPTTLLQRLRWCIDENHIQTWTYDQSGDFTHTPEQFRFKAWMRPHVVNEGLLFGIVGRDGQNLTRGLYGVFHGRLIESVTNHADDLFNFALQTAIGDGRFDVFRGELVHRPIGQSAIEQLLLN